MGNYKENMEVVKKFLDENDRQFDMHDCGHVDTFAGAADPGLPQISARRRGFVV